MEAVPPSPRNPADPLSAAEKKHLRGLAQNLDPAVIVGRGGLTATVMAEVETALRRDCLVKVKLPGAREDRAAGREAIGEATGAVCVGAVGGTASFYRPRPAESAAAADFSGASGPGAASGANAASRSKRASKSRR